MNEHADIIASIAMPSPDAVAACVRDARRLYERTLSSWAVDALNLRRTGTSDLFWHTAAGGTGSASITRFRKAA